MSPIVLLICIGMHCTQIEMPSMMVCAREMERMAKQLDTSDQTMQCIDRRRTEDPNER